VPGVPARVVSVRRVILETKEPLMAAKKKAAKKKSAKKKKK
jgi:hypothetical protein